MTLQGKSPLSNNHWLRVVLDEGHVIRNPNAMMSKAVHALKSERRWVVTGTPIQNSMKDIFSIISFLKLEPFTDRQWWRRTTERPISEGDQAALRYGKFISVWNILHRDESKNFWNRMLYTLITFDTPFPTFRGCISLDGLVEVPPDADDMDEGDGSEQWHSSSKVKYFK